MANESKNDDLVDLYRKRLHIPSEDELQPNLSTLRLLTERHLQYIPFENIAMHWEKQSSITNNEQEQLLSSSLEEEIYSSIINIAKEELTKKLLISSYGGCCLELNGLFGMLLDKIGYSSVVLVPCFSFAGKQHGHRNKKAKFRVTASHFVLLVTIYKTYMDEADFSSTSEKSNSFIVDVGLGEPSIWPLEYVLDKEQYTPEGMRSRMVWDKPWFDRHGTKRQCVVLEWFVGGEERWEPRLQWDVNDAPLELNEKYDSSLIHPRTEKLTLESFRYVIPMLLNPKSNFSRKLIVCKLTRDKKVTLAGRVLKITSPRFGPSSQKVVKDLESEDDVYAVLQTEFGIIVKNEKLSLPSVEYSKKSRLWDHL